MKRKISVILVLALIVCVFAMPASAADNVLQETEVIHTEFGDIEVTTTLQVSYSARSSRISADKIKEYKVSGTVIAKITLSVTFGYDGKTAWVEETDSSSATYDGWSYGSERISESGNTVKLTGKLSKSGYRAESVSISMTCTPTGSIS